jgi:hypothetical protein
MSLSASLLTAHPNRCRAGYVSPRTESNCECDYGVTTSLLSSVRGRAVDLVLYEVISWRWSGGGLAEAVSCLV